MKNLFVPYELALIAKEKGFDEACLKYYHTDKSLRTISDGYLNEVCSAPIHQQIVDWFRDKHKIHIEVFHQTRPANNFMYAYKIGSSSDGITDGFELYYKALNKAIEEALKLI